MQANQVYELQKKTAEYQIGDREKRPWGDYIVTDVGFNDAGEEYCEKKITVNPGRILSLQSHEHRRETWMVVRGVLTILLDGVRTDLHAGEKIHVPQGSIHCMANLGKAPCVVREKQEGFCREDDITRYIDAYGRGTQASTLPVVKRGIAAYRTILAGM